ncbi:MAG: ThiF family adenylyltransferase [Ilumatobacter sp.]|uniref:ThiF family adenylyltransferase n=1 Tax=Ilumatobacter sp. TaxID=1967498 RepID=UPI002605B8C8|nr:ThiF family adenylyltransferase [Ilumatobacter sp.]MDJ0768135.1 ThiF family adenylyltransferase [Ilumatobacter sp.]
MVVTDITFVADEGYLERSATHLTLRPEGWSPVCRQISLAGDVPVLLHTHPNGSAAFSARDDTFDRTVGAELRRTAGSDVVVSVVVAGTPAAPRFVARLVTADQFRGVDVIRIVGDRVDIHLPDDAAPLRDDVHDRAIRALGKRGKRTLGSLRVGFAGAGGTGSPAIEQVARLGVGEELVIDNDVVTASTVSRGYGTTLNDLGRPKVDVVAEHIARMGLDTTVVALNQDIRTESSRLALAQCDVVFGCTDSHASRIVLSRLAYLHLVPVIDLGVVVANTAGRLNGWGRVTWAAPGAACLLCGGHIDPQIAATESLDPTERRRLAAEGYVPDLDEPAPSVIAYTTMVAAEGVAEFLDRFLDLHSHDGASETLLQLSAHKKRRSKPHPRTGCICNEPIQWGTGRAEVDLDLLWAS